MYCVLGGKKKLKIDNKIICIHNGGLYSSTDTSLLFLSHNMGVLQTGKRKQ